MIKWLSFLFFFILMTSCGIRSKSFWAEEEEMIVKCREAWSYHDLLETQEAEVIQFRKKHFFSISAYPNFLIAVNQAGDTIGVIDKDFDGSLEVKQKVKLKPASWTEKDKELWKLDMVISKKKEKNKLNCLIQGIYYGEIEP